MSELKLTGINNRVQEFIDRLEKDDLPPEECKWIDIDVRGQVERLDGVQLRGRWQLFEHPDVKRYIEKGGTVKGFKLTVRKSGILFDFKIAYNYRMAYVTVWRGRNSLDVTSDLLDLLVSRYLKIFCPGLGV